MSDNIIALTSAHLPTGNLDHDMISFLRSLLVKAERGDITGMAVAWVEGQDNTTSYQIESGCARGELLVASVTGMFWEVNRRWRGL